MRSYMILHSSHRKLPLEESKFLKFNKVYSIHVRCYQSTYVYQVLSVVLVSK
jgi:hypothetical protein